MSPDQARLNGVRVLVVEDHEDSRIVLEQCLRLDGASVAAAATAQEAVTLLDQQAFDLVVTDYAMPGATRVAPAVISRSNSGAVSRLA